MIGLSDVSAAARRLDGVAHRTPVLTSRTLDAITGATVWLKAEPLQRTGSFKFRGAYNALASLSPAQLRAGVVAYSSGNHGQAVALAARVLGTRAVIVMPDDSAAAKVAATSGYGAEVVRHDPRRRREDVAARIAARRGLRLMRPYDDPAVMAGQGTVALELVEQVGDLDDLLVCVGGGGLIAGCSTAATGLCPGIRVVGVEPSGADDTFRSLRAGRRVGVEPRTIADGLRVPVPGRLTFPVNRRLVDEIVRVDDDRIVEAMGFLFDRLKLVTEPSGACAVAALLASGGRFAGRRVGVTVSGGNVGLARFCRLTDASRA
ncbi:MAG: pyridoxal-phosphate dependent enzyme [Actinomycetota bacterium]|nr:pyridoxal-phosphate dependent enzyme [Actinomycetota bacterium]